MAKQTNSDHNDQIPKGPGLPFFAESPGAKLRIKRNNRRQAIFDFIDERSEASGITCDPLQALVLVIEGRDEVLEKWYASHNIENPLEDEQLGRITSRKGAQHIAGVVPIDIRIDAAKALAKYLYPALTAVSVSDESSVVDIQNRNEKVSVLAKSPEARRMLENLSVEVSKITEMQIEREKE